jgi:NAD(P)-dependent dehydrogenase (short-subunit alcohol dehydrogenase family)
LHPLRAPGETPGLLDRGGARFVGTLDGKVAIVTGAGRGIGREHALLLASEGARVLVNDVGASGSGEGADATPAEEVAAEIRATATDADANHDDVASWDGAQRLVDQAIARFGRLDVLVNNAGILRDAMSFNMTEEQFDAVVKVHLKGHFAPSHFAARYWREQAKAGEAVAGRIINTASESGLFGNAGQANYAAAKAGIVSMTIVLARELARYGVTANVIAPRARTRLTATVGGAEEFMAPKEGEYDPWHPGNISPLVGFLASDAAADVTGQCFVVWGARIYLMQGWSLASTLDAGGARWTVAGIVERKDDLFAGRSPGVPPMGFGL